MSEIPRWTPKYLTSWEESGAMRPAVHGGYVDYSDHVAAMQAVLPQPKFKVGDRVLWGKDLGTVTEPERESDRVAVSWDDGDYSTVRLSDLNLYVPPVTTCGCPGGYVKKATAPTPVEIIPTLVEHEWVRGTYKGTGIAFGPCTVYYNEIGAMFAGDNNLIHWNTGKISDELATLERCDAPEVK